LTTDPIPHSEIFPEIQFLRAIAVSLVVLSHSSLALWSGGFVGVDVFFVVSGYVIGLSLINERLRTSTNSLKLFFQRRFFRIFPPLVAVIIGSSIYAYFILSFDKSQDYFVQQARAALFSYSNFFFIFHKMDYFLQNGNSIFFLHTWSLGIEEQFYLLIPILIWIVSRFVRNSDHFNHFRVWNRVFATLAVISFLTSLVLKFNIVEVGTTEFRQLFVFYSPVTRAWEFLIGILLALQWNRNRERIQKQITGRWKFAFLAGLFVLQTGILLSSHRGLLSQFGSSSATAVVTAILIFALPRLAIQQNRFVNHPVIQLVGNASYSIYLWHWIAVSIGEDMFHPPSAYQTLFLLTLSFVPALLSYQFVEKPFRRVRDLRGSTKLAIGLGLVCIPFLILSALLVTARSERRDYGNVYASSVLDGCDFLNEICKVGSPQAKKKVLIFGDSHAYQLIPILKSYAESNDVELTTCAKFCASENISNIENNSFAPGNFDLVITVLCTNANIYTAEVQTDFAKVFAKFATLRNAKHLVFLDNPYLDEFVAPRRIKRPTLLPLLRSAQEDLRREATSRWIADSSADTAFYDPFDALCDKEFCFTEVDGKSVYLDNNHYSMAGSKLVEPSFVKTLQSLLG